MPPTTAGRNRSPARDATVGIALLAAFAGLCSLVFWKLRYDWHWAGIWEYRALFVSGWLTTLKIAAGALVCSTLVGALLVSGLRSGIPPLRWFCRGYVEVIRGTPLLVQLLLGYYVVANAFEIDHPVVMGVILLSSFAGAYICEILRGGIESVGRSQIESARAVGFDRGQTYRFVILPQAVRRVLPAMAGQFVSLVKDSSLLSVIGIEELTQQARIANAATYSSLEAFLPLALGYLVLTLPISWMAARLERKLAFDT